MVEQWEKCDVALEENMFFYTPEGYKLIKQKAFIESYHKQALTTDDIHNQAVCLLLLEGWEPYATAQYYQAFRRKYHG